MLKKLLHFVLIVLVALVILFLSAAPVFAEEGAASTAPAAAGQNNAKKQDKKNPCNLEATNNPSDSSSKSIPDSFSVGDCLTVDGQKGSLFVPKKDANEQKAGQPGLVQNVIIRAIKIFLELIASIALIVFIIGALMTIVSEGKSDRLEKGKNAMVYAVIGLIIAFMSFIIVTFVQSIFF